MKSLALIVATMAIATMAQKKDLPTLDSTVNSHSKQVVCYWGTWANYRPQNGKFTPEDIDPTLCTHLIYSFAGLNSDTSSIKPLDPWMDLEKDYGLAGFRKATDLKYASPNLKVTLAIGGWNEGSKKYSEMARDENKRKIFVDSAVAFLQKHNFDGLDLDWEYPGKRGGSAQDKENFIKLIMDLREAFDKHKFLLTAAIGAAAPTIDISYDVPKMYKYLDFVHIMCYDYHGKWDKKTGHNAPLTANPKETGNELFLNLEYTINYLMKKGARPEKTVMGVPFYGRAFLLRNPNDARPGAKSRDTSFQGPYTREDGFLGYNEICEELQETDNPWEVNWDEHQKVPYMVRELKWVSFDNDNSIREKIKLAEKHKLAGIMVWSIDTDDFGGKCGGQTFPLLRTINHALYQHENGLVQSNSMKSSVVSLVLISVWAIIILL